MVTPTPISEITNVHGDADLYGGGTATPIAESDAAKYIQQAALAKATATKYVAEQHERRLNDVLSEISKIDTSDSFAPDQPAISAKYAGLMQDMANNYDVLSDPTSNIQKYGEFKARLADLQNMNQKSKAHNAIYKENQKALLLHPDLNTAENQQQMDAFTKTPMDQRGNFILKAPVTYDPAVFATVAAANSKQIAKTEKLSKDKKYIVGTDGETYDADDFVNKFIETNKTHTDSYGRTGWESLQSLYSKMPADIKPTSFDDFVSQTALASLPKNKTAVTIKPNEVAISDARLKEEYWAKKMDNALGWAKLAQDGEALKANQINPNEAAEAKNLFLWNAAHGRAVAPEFLQNVYGSDPKQELEVSGGGPTPVIGADGKPTGAIDILPVVKQKVPQKEAVSLSPDNKGGFILHYKENSLDAHNKLVSHEKTQPISFDQAMSDFNSMYGAKTAAQIASGSSIFNKKKIGKTSASIEDLDNYFDPQGKRAAADAAAAKPAAPTHKLKYNPATGNLE